MGNVRSATLEPVTSSKLHAVHGARNAWTAPNGYMVELPVILDLVNRDPAGGALQWRVAATIDLHDGAPVVTSMQLEAPAGLDLARLQREFRWNTPLEVVTRLVPRILADGLDPFDHEFPQTGYPEASHADLMPHRKLTVEFLEDIAREYLAAGRGGTAAIAEARHVSPRTVVSWIEKARRAGILTPVRPGQFGGTFVPRGRREGSP